MVGLWCHRPLTSGGRRLQTDAERRLLEQLEGARQRLQGLSTGSEQGAGERAGTGAGTGTSSRPGGGRCFYTAISKHIRGGGKRTEPCIPP